MSPSLTFLGFDFGTKRIGVAIGQSVTRTARPLATLSAMDGLPRLEEVKALFRKWHPDACVIGIPLNMDGTEQGVTAHARHFQRWLESHFHLPVHAMDERLTTRSAKEQIFEAKGFRGLKKAEVDSVAAQIILQDWLAKEYGP